MLTRLYIDNFRCFVNFEYRPAARELILGRNGSGKTTAATRLLRGALRVEEYVNADTIALGLSAFWATVVKVELTDIVFAVDSILVAVAMSNKTWVILTGGILGIVMMRLVIGQLLAIVERYPALVDGAFIIIAWVGLKLIADYLHAIGWLSWEIPHTIELVIVVVIFIGAYLYARWRGPRDAME